MTLHLFIDGPDFRLSVEQLINTLDIFVVEVADASVASTLIKLDTKVLKVFLFESNLGSDSHHLVLVVLEALHVIIDNEILETLGKGERLTLGLRHVQRVACHLRHIIGNHQSI